MTIELLTATALPALPAQPALPAPPAPPAGEPVPSPCIDVCRMDAASGLCEGCLRTIDEIAAWSQLGDAAKSEVWVALALRREALAAQATQPSRGAAR